MNHQGLIQHSNLTGFSQQELQQLIQHHDRIVNPTNNEHSKKIGCQCSDFEICEELGKGAHGVVFKVKSKKNNQYYVMKKINFNNLKASYKKEALREVQLLRRLSNPHIIKYYNSFMEEECLHIIMEYAERGDLHKYLKMKREKKETIPESEIWLIAFQIFLGVGYLHYQKIIHRDLKCMNVLIAEDGTIKIGDLGVSKVHQTNSVNLFGDSKPASQQKSRVKLDNQFSVPLDVKVGRVGTPLYLSPEVIRQQPYDYKIDTWAVGCCLFHLAALEPPFLGENIQQLGTKILNDQPKQLPNQYSEKLSNFIVNILLQKDYHTRPYINTILRKPTKYFSEDVIREYREKVFMNLKFQPSHTGANELDFIYQVLIGAGQFETTHSKNTILESQTQDQTTRQNISQETFGNNMDTRGEEQYFSQRFQTPREDPNKDQFDFKTMNINETQDQPLKSSRKKEQILEAKAANVLIQKEEVVQKVEEQAAHTKIQNMQELYQEKRTLLLSSQNNRRLSTNQNARKTIPGISLLKDQSRINDSNLSNVMKLPNHTEQNFYKNKDHNPRMFSQLDDSNTSNNSLKKDQVLQYNQYSNENVTTTIGTTFRVGSQMTQSNHKIQTISKPTTILPMVQSKRILVTDNKIKIISSNLDKQVLTTEQKQTSQLLKNQQIIKQTQYQQFNDISPERNEEEGNSTQRKSIWGQGFPQQAFKTSTNGFAGNYQVSSSAKFGRNQSSQQQNQQPTKSTTQYQPIMQNNGQFRYQRPAIQTSNSNLGNSFTQTHENNQNSRPFSKPTNLMQMPGMYSNSSGNNLPGFLNKRLTINDLILSRK
eukprot:403355851